MSVIPIRPSKLFDLVPAEGMDRVMQIRIPKRRNLDGPDRSVMLLETMVLLACAELTRATRIFEFGTCLGSTAVNLALNRDVDVFTLDLDQESAQSAQQTSQDRDTTAFSLTHPMEWERFPASLRRRVIPLHGDSTRFDFSAYWDSMDLVWIDGGHDLRTVASDSANAFHMRRRYRLSAVAWHDYRNADCMDITEYLDRIQTRLFDRPDAWFPVYWVEDTMIVLHFNRDIGF